MEFLDFFFWSFSPLRFPFVCRSLLSENATLSNAMKKLTRDISKVWKFRSSFSSFLFDWIWFWAHCYWHRKAVIGAIFESFFVNFEWIEIWLVNSSFGTMYLDVYNLLLALTQEVVNCIHTYGLNSDVPLCFDGYGNVFIMWVWFNWVIVPITIWVFLDISSRRTGLCLFQHHAR